MIKPAPPTPVEPVRQPQSTGRDDVAEQLLRDVLENIIDGGR